MDSDPNWIPTGKKDKLEAKGVRLKTKFTIQRLNRQKKFPVSLFSYGTYSLKKEFFSSNPTFNIEKNIIGT